MGDISIRDFPNPNFDKLASTAKTMDSALTNLAKALGDPNRTLPSSEATNALNEMRVLALSAQAKLHEFRKGGGADAERLASISILIQALPALLKSRLNLPLVRHLPSTDTTNLVAKIKRMEKVVSGLTTSRAGVVTVYKVDDLMTHFFPSSGSRKSDALKVQALALEASDRASSRINDLITKIRAHGPVEPVGAKTVRDSLHKCLERLQELQTSDAATAAIEEEYIDVVDEINFLVSIPDYALGITGQLIRAYNALADINREASSIRPELIQLLGDRINKFRDENLVATMAGGPSAQARYDALYRNLNDELLVIRQLVLVDQRLIQNEGKSFPAWAVQSYSDLQAQYVSGRLTNAVFASKLGALEQFFDHVQALDRLIPALTEFEIQPAIIQALRAAVQEPTGGSVQAENVRLTELRHLAGLLLGCCRMEEKTENNLLILPPIDPDRAELVESYLERVSEVAAFEELWAEGDYVGLADGLLETRRGLSALSRIVSNKLTVKGVDVAGQAEIRFSPYAKGPDPDEVPLENLPEGALGSEVTRLHKGRVSAVPDQAFATRLAELKDAVTEERLQKIVENATTSQSNAKRGVSELAKIKMELQGAFQKSNRVNVFEQIFEVELAMIDDAIASIRSKYPRA